MGIYFLQTGFIAVTRCTHESRDTLQYLYIDGVKLRILFIQKEGLIGNVDQIRNCTNSKGAERPPNIGIAAKNWRFWGHRI